MTRFAIAAISAIMLHPATVFADTPGQSRLWNASTQAEPDLPPDVQARVAELRRHGDRFAAAIRLIEAEAGKPAWAGSGDCDHGAWNTEPAPSF